MKEKILFILLLLLVPTFVLAKDTCNSTDIKIKSIALKDTNGFSEEVEEANINNNVINLNLKLYDVGDSSTYNITIENNSSEEYYFTNDSFKMDTDYIEYQLKNNSEVIPAKSEKEVELRVTYKSRIVGDSYSDIKKLSITLADKPLENPETNANHYIFFIILLVMIPICIHYNKKGLFLLGIFGLITNVHAICTVNLNVEAKIEIENKEAIFLPGQEVNVKMKQLAGDDTSTNSQNPHTVKDNNIISIKESNIEPVSTNKEEKNIVSTLDSPYPIYMWYEDSTIYWWSEDIHPGLNEDASYMFYYLFNLNDISGLENFDVSNTKKINYYFRYDSITNVDSLRNWNTTNLEEMNYMLSWNMELISIDGLEKWDTSNVKSMIGVFYNTHKLLSVDAVKNWNVSNVINMKYLFACAYSLEEIDLRNWHTDKLENMDFMFASLYYSQDYSLKSVLKRISLSENFNTSKVATMVGLFYNDQYIEDYSFLEFFDDSSLLYIDQMFQGNTKFNSLSYLKDWDVSKIKSFYLLFSSCKSLTSLSGLENWNVSNAEKMERMFYDDNNITDISAIKDWDVSKVTNYNNMFAYNSSLHNTNQVNNWNISPTATFTQMFVGVPTHPEFTKVQGTWTGGTFTPTV